jgi:hypothetical protein
MVDEVVREIKIERIYTKKPGRKPKAFPLEQARAIRNRIPQPGWRTIANELACGVSYATVRRRLLE